MLNFKSWNIGLISLICLLGIIYAIPNFTSFPKVNSNSFLPGKTINLGLDLQGGSYLLLEIDNEPVIEQKLQNLTTTIRNYFKEKNIKINKTENIVINKILNLEK